jgi:hypothetical protein
LKAALNIPAMYRAVASEFRIVLVYLLLLALSFGIHGGFG